MYNKAYVLSWLECHTYTFVKFQLNWCILKILTFEPIYDPLITFYNISYILSSLECHSHTFSQDSAE